MIGVQYRYVTDGSPLSPGCIADPKCGERSVYVNQGCRGDNCKRGNAEYKSHKVSLNRRIAASQVISNDDESNQGFEHGTPAGYEWHGCRCVKCTAAARTSWRLQALIRRLRNKVLA